MFSFQFSLVSFLFSNFSFLVSVFSFQCPKAEKLSLPRGSNLQPESFAHSFSSTKQPSASTENPDISFVTGSSPSTSPSTSARASAPTAKVGSGEEEEEKPETSSASSAIRFGDRRRKKRQAAAGERRKRQLAREEEEECVNNFCEDEQVGTLSLTEESNVYPTTLAGFVFWRLIQFFSLQNYWQWRDFFYISQTNISLLQNYPGSEVLSALTQHPAMSGGLFHQLFDTQCKVNGHQSWEEEKPRFFRLLTKCLVFDHLWLRSRGDINSASRATVPRWKWM